MATKAWRTHGNVFKDLGFSVEDAENLKIRADLMSRLAKRIDTQRLSQAAAAKLLHVSQPRISDLVRGKIDRFSIDTLVAMLGHAGVEVSVVVRTRRQVA